MALVDAQDFFPVWKKRLPNQASSGILLCFVGLLVDLVAIVVQVVSTGNWAR